jgi:hypothetical protein
VLLLAFAGLMLIAAAAMSHRSTLGPADAGVPSDDGGGLMAMSRTRVDVALVVRVLVCGTAVGFVTGFFGVGGGFVIVPALVVCMGFALPEAAATSLLVIAINAGVSLVARADTGTLDWGVAVPFTVAAMLGSILGSRIAGRVDHDHLTRVFVVLLVVVAFYTGLRSAMELL